MNKPKFTTNMFMSSLVEKMTECYQEEKCMQHLDATFLPSRKKTIDILEKLRRVIFPGFFDEKRITSEKVNYHIGNLLICVSDMLYDQVRQAIRYDANAGCCNETDSDSCDKKANEITKQFLEKLPEIHRLLSLDVQATFDGDPASASTDENIFCYPGLDAIFIHRVAHELFKLGVPLLPRIMSEYAHNETGIDIHPGAQIGEKFCIDHGTGIVVGETCVIGNNVKIYQGVTLGALSTKGGQDWKGMKRHPNIEDDVTIYPNSTILGGSTTIGQGATIGGSVFITSSIPAWHRVTSGDVSLNISPPKKGKKKF